MKCYLLVALSILCLESFSQTLISGKVGNASGDRVVLQYWEDFNLVKDTVQVNRVGQFRKEYHFSKSMSIRFVNLSGELSTPFFLVLPGDTLQIDITKSDFDIEGGLATYNSFVVRLIQEMRNYTKSSDINVITQVVLDKSDAALEGIVHPRAAEIRTFNNSFWIVNQKLSSFLMNSNNNSDPAKMKALLSLWKGNNSQIENADKELYKYLDRVDFNNPLVCQNYDILNMLNNFIRICRMLEVEGDSTLSEVDHYEVETKLINEVFAGTLMKTPLLAFNLHYRLKAYREFPAQLSGVEEYINVFAKEKGSDSFLPAIKKIYREQSLTKGVIAPGAKAPEFKLHDVSGKMVSLSDFRNKVVYIDFWATWCVPCLKQMPYLNALKEKFKGKDVAILSISIDTDTEKWRKKIVDLKLDGVQLIDSIGSHDSKIAQNYKLTGVPNFVLIDKKGRIHLPAAPAPSDTAQIEASINELLNK